MDMEKSMVLFFSILALAIAMPSDACTNIPSMDIAGACHRASTSPRMFDLCMATLRGVNDHAEVLTYAVAEANTTVRSFQFTADNLLSISNTPSTSEDMKAVLKACVSKYGEAQKLVDGVVRDLKGCFFDNVKNDCVYAVVTIDDCYTALLLVNPGAPSPIRDTVLVDRDRAALTLRLISLFH